MAPSTKILARVTDAADDLVLSSRQLRGWETVRRAGLFGAFGAFALGLLAGAPALLLGPSCLALAILLLAPRREMPARAALRDVIDGWDDEEEAPASGDLREVAPMSGVRSCAQEVAAEEVKMGMG